MSSARQGVALGVGPPPHPVARHDLPVFRADAVIRHLAELLRALGTSDIWALQRLVDDEVALSAHLEHDAHRVTMHAGRCVVALDYPFSLLEFWVAVRDVDELSSADLEDCGR